MNQRPLALVDATLLPALEGGADSVLIERGRITRVGRGLCGELPPGTEVVALEGGTLSPGFHDAHFHFLQTGTKASRPSLAGCRSLDEVLQATRSAADARPGPEILLLEAWDEEHWPRPETPTRERLDEVIPERPVILRRACDHVAVANSRALAFLLDRWPGAGIDGDSGVLKEDPVLLLEEMLPSDEEETERAIETAGRLCLSLGITSASDFLRPGACRSYRAHLDGGTLPVRVNAYALAEVWNERGLLASMPVHDRFRLRGVKIFADGSIGGRTAALFEAYHDRPGVRGRLVHTDDALASLLRRAHDRGLAAAVHAIGDRAIAQVLDGFGRFPPDEIRQRHHRIEHLELPRPRDVGRLVDLGVRPCVQPNFLRWAQPSGLYETALGKERLRGMNPFRTLLEAGTGVFFGSDGMPPSPLFGIRAATNHPVESERLTWEEAHRLYTEAPSIALGEAGGRIAVGERADLVVLSAGPFRGVPEVLLTVLDGEVAWRADPLVSPTRTC